jgi:ABC-type sugar transport system ATPase subunit
VQVSVAAVEGWEPARALVVEPMGSELLVTIDWQGRRLVARTAADLPVQPDAPVSIRLPPERVLFFGANGRRIGPAS